MRNCAQSINNVAVIEVKMCSGNAILPSSSTDCIDLSSISSKVVCSAHGQSRSARAVKMGIVKTGGFPIYVSHFAASTVFVISLILGLFNFCRSHVACISWIVRGGHNLHR